MAQISNHVVASLNMTFESKLTFALGTSEELQSSGMTESKPRSPSTHGMFTKKLSRGLTVKESSKTYCITDSPCHAAQRTVWKFIFKRRLTYASSEISSSPMKNMVSLKD
jgi:hypothetical protein